MEKPKRIALGEGIYLNFVENKQYKTNYFSAFFVTELTPRTASYNTLLSRVLLRGSEKYPTQKELNRALDLCYDAVLNSDAGKIGERHVLSFTLSFLDKEFTLQKEDVWPEGLGIFCDLLFHPAYAGGAFQEKYVKSERERAIDEIAALVNHKAQYARRRMLEIMCENEPYGTSSLGEETILRRITPAKLTAYYEKLLRESRIELYFVGRGDPEKLAKELTPLFAGRERKVRPLPEVTLGKAPAEIKRVTEEMEITQANLVMGFRMNTTLADPDWRAMSVYNAVLGGSLTSKLFCVVREKLSLCYTVQSLPDAMKGTMQIYAGIAPEKKEVAEREILHQMELIRRGEITEEELESARSYLIHAMRGLPDNPAVLAEWYLPRILAGDEKTPLELAADLKWITKEDVVRVSQKLQPDTVYVLTAKGGKA